MQVQFAKYKKILHTKNGYNTHDETEELTMSKLLQDTIVKSIRLDVDLCEKIQKMADENQRDFTKQVRFMLMEYIAMKDRK